MTEKNEGRKADRQRGRQAGRQAERKKERKKERKAIWLLDLILNAPICKGWFYVLPLPLC